MHLPIVRQVWRYLILQFLGGNQWHSFEKVSTEYCSLDTSGNRRASNGQKGRTGPDENYQLAIYGKSCIDKIDWFIPR